MSRVFIVFYKRNLHFIIEIKSHVTYFHNKEIKGKKMLTH